MLNHHSLNPHLTELISCFNFKFLSMSECECLCLYWEISASANFFTTCLKITIISFSYVHSFLM